MFETIMKFFSGTKLAGFITLLSHLSSILQHLEANYPQDKDAYNAALDTIIQFCQAHKKDK